MTTAELRDAAHRLFVRLAPAVLACEGEVGLERTLLGDPSQGIAGRSWAMATKADHDYFLRQLMARDRETGRGELQKVLHAAAEVGLALTRTEDHGNG